MDADNAQPDKEIEALDQIVKIFMQLDAQARARVLTYLMARHNSAISDKKE